MKFKCRMNDIPSMRDFSNSALYLMVEDERYSTTWAELKQEHFFDRYTMAGVCQEMNEIYLEFDPNMFSRSLSSLRTTAKSVEIKLTNKQQPCLTVEIEMPSIGAQARQCVHDVPVRLIPRREWTAYKLAELPPFDISIDMPLMRNVRSVVERLRNMSPFLKIEANESGNLAFKVETDWADISTHFNNLHVWNSKEELVTVNLDVKKFLMFMAWDVLHPETVKCNIVNQKLVNFHLQMDPYLSIQCVVPSIDD